MSCAQIESIPKDNQSRQSSTTHFTYTQLCFKPDHTILSLKDTRILSYSVSQSVSRKIIEAQKTKFSILASEMEKPQSPLNSSTGFRHRNHSSYATKYGSAPSYHHTSRNNTGVEFRTELKDTEASEAFSPPLWTTSPSRNAEYRKSHYKSLSPALRTQAIARGQLELMEMVKNMPESNYELTLRDLVKQPTIGAEQENEPEERSLNSESSYGSKDNISGRKKFDHKVHIKRSGKIDSGGFYIKVAFPTSLGSKKKNSKRYDQFERNNLSPKVSPRPSVSDGSAKGVERDWWNKSFSGSGNSESGVSSMNSGSTKSIASNSSSSSNSSRAENGGCWSFIRKSKPQLQNDN